MCRWYFNLLIQAQTMLAHLSNLALVTWEMWTIPTGFFCWSRQVLICHWDMDSPTWHLINSIERKLLFVVSQSLKFSCRIQHSRICTFAMHLALFCIFQMNTCNEVLGFTSQCSYIGSRKPNPLQNNLTDITLHHVLFPSSLQSLHCHLFSTCFRLKVLYSWYTGIWT